MSTTNLGPQFGDDEHRRDTEARTRVIDDLVSQGFPVNSIHVNEHGQATVHYRIGNWIGKYKGGHIDVAHASNPDSSLDMINLYDYQKGAYNPVSPSGLHQHLNDWIQQKGAEYGGS